MDKPKQKTRHSVITCRQAAKIAPVPRHYGYTLKLTPPEVFTTDGNDVEGIGWVPHTPRKHTLYFRGWYKYKSDAVKRANDLNA